jgi:hypothetical protein
MFDLRRFIVDSHCKIIAHYRELLATTTSDEARDHIGTLIENMSNRSGENLRSCRHRA